MTTYSVRHSFIDSRVHTHSIYAHNFFNIEELRITSSRKAKGWLTGVECTVYSVMTQCDKYRMCILIFLSKSRIQRDWKHRLIFKNAHYNNCLYNLIKIVILLFLSKSRIQRDWKHRLIFKNAHYNNCLHPWRFKSAQEMSVFSLFLLYETSKSWI